MEPPLKRQRTVQSQEQLHEQRARNDLRLKSRFENIFEKFSKDFTGVGDEIDMGTGQVIVNNGHLLTMQNERDIQGLANDEDELAAETVEPSKTPEAGKSKVSGNIQGNATEAVPDLPLPMELPCIGLNIASVIKMDDGTTYDNSVHGDLSINRTLLDQLHRLGPHIRKSIANVKRSTATSLVVSIETEDLTVDPKWRVPVLLQQKPDGEVDQAVDATETVEADPITPECDPERSQSPEGVSLWALDTLPAFRKDSRRKEAAAKPSRSKDQVLKNSRPKDLKYKVFKPKDSKSTASQPVDPRHADPKPEDPKFKDTKSTDLQPKGRSPADTKPKDPKSKDPTPRTSKLRHLKLKGLERDDLVYADLKNKDQGSKDGVHGPSWTADEEKMLPSQRTEHGLALDQTKIPGRSPRFIADRWDFTRLDGLDGTPSSFPCIDSPAGEDSKVAASSPSIQKQGSNLGRSKHAHSLRTGDSKREVLAEGAPGSARNRNSGRYEKTKEPLGLPVNYEAEPVGPSALAVTGESGGIPDIMVTNAILPPRNRKRGLYKKTRERLSVTDTHAEQAEPTKLAVAKDNSIVADSQAPSSGAGVNASLKVASESLPLKGRKRKSPSPAGSLEDAHGSPNAHQIDRPIIGHPVSKTTLSPEIPPHGVQGPKRRERKATAKPTVPERQEIFSEAPETLMSGDLASAAVETEIEHVPQPSSFRKTRVEVRSKLAGLPTPVHDDKKKLSGKPGRTHGRSSSPSPLDTNIKSVVSGWSKDLTPRSLVSPSTPDGITSSVKLNSSVRTRVSVKDGSALRRRALRSISSSPDPVADDSVKTNNITESSPLKHPLRRTPAQQRVSKPTARKCQPKSASFAPRILISSILGDASDDELSNINPKDQVLNPTKSPLSAIKSLPCGSPAYNCKRTLCLTCN